MKRRRLACLASLFLASLFLALVGPAACTSELCAKIASVPGAGQALAVATSIARPISYLLLCGNNSGPGYGESSGSTYSEEAAGNVALCLTDDREEPCARCVKTSCCAAALACTATIPCSCLATCRNSGETLASCEAADKCEASPDAAHETYLGCVADHCKAECPRLQ